MEAKLLQVMLVIMDLTAVVGITTLVVVEVVGILKILGIFPNKTHEGFPQIN